MIGFKDTKFGKRIQFLRDHCEKGFPAQPMNVAEADAHECKNCHTQYRGNYCPCCGQSANTKRFAERGVIKQMLMYFTRVDSTMVHTISELFYRPGYMISDYINCKRANYYKPVAMLTSLVGFYLLLCFAFSPETINGAKEEIGNIFLDAADDPDMARYPMVLSLFKSLSGMAQNYLVLKFYVIFVAVLIYKLVFNWTAIGRQTNLAEHFYIRVNLVCMAMILDLLAFFPTLICTGHAVIISGMSCTLPLGIWIYKQFFRITWWKSIVLNIIAYFLALVLVIAMIAGIIFTTMGINWAIITLG